ncbi:MAG: MFS transporter [Betaproteobacteria bacterium]|nr:MFS transporter [Betaproteobacteria bacterium]MBI2961337.1 MFS transporter [Betaproteobacteria bacterium]
MSDSHASAAAVPHQSFAALRHSGFRAFFITSALSMMADSIEHVISYWMMFEKFHSPALGGFAVLSHWLPFLLFSVHSGALADRFDPRRIIQLGMLLFMAVSLGWGLLFLSDSLEMWHAVVLLVVHGFAGVLWNPASQMLIHDIVGAAQLQSAVRLTATSRWLGLLMGPAVGGGMLLVLGPAHGILFNVLIYLPLVAWLWRAPYGPRFRTGEAAPARAVRGLADIVSTIRDISGNRTIASMIVLGGLASLIVGNSYQAQMPEFAHDLGHGDAGIFYSMLLAADAAGAFVAGVVLESRGLLPARPRTAFVLAMLWCCALVGFAASSSYALALALLFAAGFLELSFNAMAQTLVQLDAPAPIRGRVIGLFLMSNLGLRAFSGITVGIGGSLIGIHWSLALSAAALLALTVAMLAFTARGAAKRQ